MDPYLSINIFVSIPLYSPAILFHFQVLKVNFIIFAPWCSGYHYCTTWFSEAWNQVLHGFKSCLQRVGDSRWWVSLTMVPAGNKTKRLSPVNHTTKTIHHHHFMFNYLSAITLSYRNIKQTTYQLYELQFKHRESCFLASPPLPH